MKLHELQLDSFIKFVPIKLIFIFLIFNCLLFLFTFFILLLILFINTIILFFFIIWDYLFKVLTCQKQTNNHSSKSQNYQKKSPSSTSKQILTNIFVSHFSRSKLSLRIIRLFKYIEFRINAFQAIPSC